jgi:hypothetical protein
MDLEKLTPAPWTCEEGERLAFVTRSGRCIGSFGWWEGEDGNADAAFIALARNAFDGDPEALAWWEANRRRRENVEGKP